MTKKTDDQKMLHNFKAIRVAYVFTIISLIAYCLGVWYSAGNMPTIPFLIVCTQALVLRITKNLLGTKHKAIDTD